MPGDYDGDGHWESAVAARQSGLWETGGARGTFDFAAPPPTGVPPFYGPYIYPVPGDYDGNGKTDAAWFREDDATWWIEGSGAPIQFGIPYQPGKFDQDIAVPGDYDGDGKTDLAVYRSGTATFTIQGRPPVIVGLPASLPAPADYDGDGGDDPAAQFWGSVYPTTQSPSFSIVGQTSVPLEFGFPAPANYDGVAGAEVTTYVYPENNASGRLAFGNGTSIILTGATLGFIAASVRPYLLVNILRLTAVFRCHHDSTWISVAAC